MELEVQHSLEVCIVNFGYVGTVRLLGSIGVIFGIIFWEASRGFARFLIFAFRKGYGSINKNREVTK